MKVSYAVKIKYGDYLSILKQLICKAKVNRLAAYVATLAQG